MPHSKPRKKTMKKTTQHRPPHHEGKPFYPAPIAKPQTVIYREVAIGLEAFDHLKRWQRYLARKEGQHLTNGETIDRLLLAVPAPSAPDTRRRRD